MRTNDTQGQGLDSLTAFPLSVVELTIGGALSSNETSQTLQVNRTALAARSIPPEATVGEWRPCWRSGESLLFLPPVRQGAPQKPSKCGDSFKSQASFRHPSVIKNHWLCTTAFLHRPGRLRVSSCLLELSSRCQLFGDGPEPEVH
jgi:hypothetical protein